MIICLVILAGILALFLRGFTFHELTAKKDNVVIPAQTVWIVSAAGYPDKMEAYKTGINLAPVGMGTYVMANGNSWNLILGVYQDEITARTVLELNKNCLPDNTICQKMEINQKKFSQEINVANLCNQLLTTIQCNYEQLNQLRELTDEKQNPDHLIINLTKNFNDIKKIVEELHQINSDTRSDFLSSMIYTANQNILCLYDVIFANCTGNEYLSIINTAMIKIIFSLDNF